VLIGETWDNVNTFNLKNRNSSETYLKTTQYVIS
jgi:hypothetical protein